MKALAKWACRLVSFSADGMTATRTIVQTCLIVGAATVSAMTAAAREPWLDIQWTYRRAVTVSDVPGTGLEGEEVGVVTMPTGGLLRADGQDVRVATATGVLVPHRLLMIGPGDTVRLAFALRRPHTKYFVYFGNAKADKPKRELQVRRGILLETWEYRGGPMGGLSQVRGTFARAGALIGRDFRGSIFLGHNPFGPQNRICSLFTGYLICPDEGEYIFATSSQDASFLLVDDELVVSNGGSHPPQRRAERQGRIRLAKGLHELKVYHVNGARDPVIMAAWKPPKGRRLWKIPPEAFAPVHRAECGSIERYAQEVQVDFIPVHAGETFVANKYFQRYVFSVMVAGPGAAGGTFDWSFGDGQAFQGRTCEHVYLSDGLAKVALTARVGGLTLHRTNTIYVTRPWDQVAVNRLDPVADHARIVSGYDFDAADPRDIGHAIGLFERSDMTAALLRAGGALMKRDKAPAAVLRDAVPVYAEALVESAGGSARAVPVLLKAAEMTGNPAVCAALTVRAGQIALSAGEPDKALGIFRGAIKKYAALVSASAVRDARIGIGDVHRLRGDYEDALKAYRSARPLQRSGVEKEAVRRGDLARHVEAYVREGTYHDAEDFLDRWEQEFPVDKLEGHSTLLRVRVALARARFAFAAEQAEVLVRVNPNSNYAPELLMLAAGAYKSLDKDALAGRALRRVAKDYPESPLAAEAKKRLSSD